MDVEQLREELAAARRYAVSVCEHALRVETDVLRRELVAICDAFPMIEEIGYYSDYAGGGEFTFTSWVRVPSGDRPDADDLMLDHEEYGDGLAGLGELLRDLDESTYSMQAWCAALEGASEGSLEPAALRAVIRS